jgi:superfamily II DNA helicase RecQ
VKTLTEIGILYYRGADAVRQSSMVVSEQSGVSNLRGMMKYAENIQECRRVLISSYFGENFTKAECNQTCDNCANPKSSTATDITEHAQTIVSIVSHVQAKNEKLTLLQLIDVWRGSGNKKLRFVCNNFLLIWQVWNSILSKG